MKTKFSENTLNQGTGRRSTGHRKGAAVVEFAVCLPVIVLIVFGAIEAASMMFLRQALVQASYESIKIAARDGGTQQAAILVAEQVAAGRRIEDLNITFTPDITQDQPRGTLLRVRISAPAESNSLVPFGIFRNRFVSADAAMIKE